MGEKKLNKTEEKEEKLSAAPSSASRGAAKDKETKRKKTVKAAPALKKGKCRSKKYLRALAKVDPGRSYSLGEAIKRVKGSSYSKFDGTISLTVKLAKVKKSEEAVRGTIALPRGTGKSRKVKVASEEIIERIKKGWSDFDVLVASPAMMPKLAAVAKILGPKGKMPNPKDQTVVDDPEAAVADLAEKIARLRADAAGNIHIAVGRVSWEEAKLAENIAVVLKSLIRFKKEGVYLSATMGPGIRVDAA